jgi:hypothetical protein
VPGDSNTSKGFRETIRYVPPDKYCNRAINRPCRNAILPLATKPMEQTMHRLLIAASLGLGLLSAGGLIGSAFASPAGNHLASHATDRSALVTSVHDDGHHSRWAPPVRHWHRQWHEHSQYHRPDGYRYSWR